MGHSACCQQVILFLATRCFQVICTGSRTLPFHFSQQFTPQLRKTVLTVAPAVSVPPFLVPSQRETFFKAARGVNEALSRSSHRYVRCSVSLTPKTFLCFQCGMQSLYIVICITGLRVTVHVTQDCFHPICDFLQGALRLPSLGKGRAQQLRAPPHR